MMSEQIIQDNQDQMLKTALKELERNRDILTGKTFRKYYQFIWPFIWVILFPLLFILISNHSIDPETLSVICLPIASGIGVVVLIFTISTTDNINKRIDKIVELTGAEIKLEEKYYSNIKIITGSYPKKTDA